MFKLEPNALIMLQVKSASIHVLRVRTNRVLFQTKSNNFILNFMQINTDQLNSFYRENFDKL